MTLAIASTSTYSHPTGSASHVLPLPSGTAADDLVRIYFASQGGPTVTDPAGWAALVSKVNGDTYRIYAKIVNSTDVSAGAVTVGLSGSNRVSAVLERITGARNGVASSELAVSSAVDANTATPDPPGLDPGWGTEEILYTAVTFSSDGNFTFNNYPSGYTLGQNNVQTGSGTGNAISVASALLTAASEDPGAFSTTTSRNRSTYTLAVRTLAAAAINGDLAAIEEGDTVAATGALALHSALSRTEAPDAVGAAGLLPVAGVFSRSEAGDVVASAGALPLAATAAVTEAGDWAVATAAIFIRGFLSRPEEDDTPVATALVPVGAQLSIVEDDDRLVSGFWPVLQVRPRGGPWPAHDDGIAWSRRDWDLDLRRIIDEAWRIADGEIDPVTRADLPAPDLSVIHGALSLLAERQADIHMRAAIGEQERSAEDEAMALLLLAA